MKNRTDKILLAGFVLSLLVYAAVLLTALEIFPYEFWNWPDWVQTLFIQLAVGFHAVPVFCLQLLLCRRARRWAAAIPAVSVVGAALCFLGGFFAATGWDMLGWGILLVLTAAPAVGCALAWAAYGLHRISRRRDICR